MPAAAHDPGTGLGHTRVLTLGDFADPGLQRVMREVFPHEVARFGPAFPLGHEYRKHWEIAMAIRALDDHGLLRRDARALGVAAGNEPTVFWLTTRMGEVVATDLYRAPGVWAEFATPAMLRDPGSQWPGAWEPARLAVEHMDARELAYPDACFDAVVSSSSVEHLGGPDDVRRAMSEIHRVLRPGGVAAISTEYRLEGPPPGVPGTLMLDADDVMALLVGDLAWEPTSPLRTPSPEEAGQLVELAFPAERYVEEIRRHCAVNAGTFLLHRIRYSSYPQVSLRLDGSVWTSVHVALRRTG